MCHRALGTFPRDYKFPQDVDVDAFLSAAGDEFNTSTFKTPDDVSSYMDDPLANVAKNISDVDVPDQTLIYEDPPLNIVND